MAPTYFALKQELKSYLIDSSMAKEEPAVMREVPLEVMINNLLDYMIGKGYVSTN